jgi:hypothetical protein
MHYNLKEMAAVLAIVFEVLMLLCTTLLFTHS